MSGHDFLRIANCAFSPFLRELGFSTDSPSISGRFYRISFTSQDHVVWISFEPGDDALFILVFSLENGELSDIDDRLKTPRLADLNRRYMHMVTKEERIENEEAFKQILVQDQEERLLLKAAKELRIVLPKYLGQARHLRRGQ